MPYDAYVSSKAAVIDVVTQEIWVKAEAEARAVWRVGVSHSTRQVCICLNNKWPRIAISDRNLLSGIYVL